MKYLPSSASFLSCLATTAACLSFPLASASADDHYRMETHGPRIGTRILFFVADVATLQNPNDRYRHLPKNQQRYQEQQQRQQQQQQRPPMAPPQQLDPGIRPSGQRYSLDRPPIPNESAPQRPPQVVAPEEDAPAPRDLPYETQDAPPSDEREKRPSTVGSQHQEEAPPVKVKPKTTPPEPKPTASPKPQVEEAPPKPSKPKHEATPPTETLTASNNTASSKKSWQSFGNETPSTTSAPAPTPAPTPPPTVENPPAPTAPVTPNSATLTGSKTSKEGRVKSPYAPFNELDVTGLPAGSLAMDPTTGKVFRVP